MKRTRLLIPALWLLLAPTFLSAQQPQPVNAQALTVDSIFTYRARSLGPIQWQQDGTGYLALEPSPTRKGFLDIVRYDALSGDRTIKLSAEKLTPAAATEPLLVENFDLSADGQKLLVFTKSERVWRGNTRGDYWVVDLKDGGLRKLGGAAAKPSTLMFAKFSPDATLVGYVRENNIYVENLTGSGIKQITKDGTRYIVNGTFDWVYEEELFCRDGFRWSPDGKNIAYWQLNTEGVKEFQLINNTAGLYPVVTSFPYPKAGETNSAARVGVVRASGGSTRWFDIAGDPRNNYLPRMEWAASSDEVVIQQLNRLQNTNIVMLGDIRTGKVRPVLTEKDEAWVDVGWGDLDWDKTGLARGDVEWIDGGKRFLWTSERDGWRHIYSVSRDGGDVKNITPGDYDVMGVEKVDAANGWLYFRASPENSGQRYLYRTRLSGEGKAEKLTSESGTHAYNISPRGDLAVHFFSTFNRVPRTDIVRLPDHTVARTLIDNAVLQERIEKLKRGPSEFFRVAIGEGTERIELDGWMIKPPDFDPQKRYPVLFYVYGEPWSQTVLDAWGGRNELWHLMLAQQGYIVMSIDSRGTPAPRGRVWRKSIYRKVGIVNSADHANAVREIKKWPYVDPTRVAIWGWSGGGSSTLSAMFRYPDVYNVGMSVAPVPDLRYYDTIYQERYGGLPQDHPEEWKQSSPITFAGSLQGQLLVVHGTGDDNVHYQGTEALIDKLIAANKQFSVMPYPNRSHGITEGPGTLRHLYGLLTRYLNEKLPAGGR